MQYYDAANKTILSENDLSRRGLTDAVLPALGIFPILEILPEFDGRYYHPVPGEVAEEGGEYVRRHTAQPLPLAFVRAAKKEDATDLRWQRETGGISLPDGTRILTAVEDQNRIATAIQGMRDKGLTEVDFKAATGWVTLTLEQIVVIAGLVTAHVQACFSRERALHEAIDACADLNALNAIDLDAGWPGAPAPDDEGPAAAVEDAEGAV